MPFRQRQQSCSARARRGAARQGGIVQLCWQARRARTGSWCTQPKLLGRRPSLIRGPRRNSLAPIPLHPVASGQAAGHARERAQQGGHQAEEHLGGAGEPGSGALLEGCEVCRERARARAQPNLRLYFNLCSAPGAPGPHGHAQPISTACAALLTLLALRPVFRRAGLQEPAPPGHRLPPALRQHPPQAPARGARP